jgi:hypothetical protein
MAYQDVYVGAFDGEEVVGVFEGAKVVGVVGALVVGIAVG